MADAFRFPKTRRTGEFELIRRVAEIAQTGTGTPPIVGIGDDAACIPTNGRALIITTDAMSEGSHFRIGQISWEDIGWKAMVSNQSDIAAMGGSPMYAVVSIGITRAVTPEHVEEMYRGMTRSLEKFGGVCIGGDTVASESLFISVTLIGEAYSLKGEAPLILRRDGARLGDLVAVTGPVGGAAGGLAAIEQGMALDTSNPLLVSHLHPEPRIAEGNTLARLGVRCAMDISDGLAGDLEKVAAASGLSAILRSGDVPIPSELKEVFPNEAITMALSGGEDYELLFTAPPLIMERVLKQVPSAKVVGCMTERSTSANVVIILSDSGERMELDRMGWDNLGD